MLTHRCPSSSLRIAKVFSEQLGAQLVWFKQGVVTTSWLKKWGPQEYQGGIKAVADKFRIAVNKHSYFALRWYSRFIWEYSLPSIQYRILLQYCCLTLIMPEWLHPVKTLIKDNPNAPHIHFTGDLWWCLSDHKTLWWQIPATMEIVTSVNRAC